jgi:hypothetical protein
MKLKELLWDITLVCLFVLILSNHLAVSQTQEQNQIERMSEMASSLKEKVRVKEKELEYVRDASGGYEVLLEWESEKKRVELSILNKSTVEEATRFFESFGPIINQGHIEKINGIGDEAYAAYFRGSFSGYRFRKGKYIISIRVRSEEMAKRFVNYALEEIAN